MSEENKNEPTENERIDLRGIAHPFADLAVGHVRGQLFVDIRNEANPQILAKIARFEPKDVGFWTIPELLALRELIDEATSISKHMQTEVHSPPQALVQQLREALKQKPAEDGKDNG